MKIFNVFRFLPCLVLMLVSSYVAFAQQVASFHEPSLDITEESFWTDNDAAIVQVKTFNLDEKQQAKITTEIVKPIAGRPDSGRPTDLFKKVGFSNGYKYIDWNPIVDRNGIVLHPGEMLAIYRASHPDPMNTIPPPTYITRLEQGLDSNLAKSLITIRQIRSGGNTPKSLMQKAFDSDSFAAVYCLKQLLSRRTSRLPYNGVFVSRLMVLRNNESADVQVRILASHLTNQIKTGSVLGGDEYEWAKQAIGSSRKIDFYQLNDLVAEMAAFPEKRPETVSFLIAQLRNPVPERY